MFNKNNTSDLSSNRHLKLGAIASYGSIFINIAVGLLFTPWMLMQIGKSDYGLYVLVTAFISYFVMDFGLGSTISKFLAHSILNNQQQVLNNLLSLTSRLYITIALILFLVLGILYFFLEDIFIELAPSEMIKFKIVYLISATFAVFSFPFIPLDSILLASEKFIFLKICDILNKLVSVTLLVFFIHHGYKLYAIIVVNAIVAFLIIFAKFYYIKKNTSIKLNFKFRDTTLIKELFNTSSWITIIGISQRLLINICPFILGIVSGTAQIAIFSIGIIIEGYVWLFANALNGLFLPKVTKLVSIGNDKIAVVALMITVGRYQLIIVGLLLAGMISLGHDFVILWIGKEFSESYYVIILLIIPGIITLTQEIAHTYLLVINKLRSKAILLIIASLFSTTIAFFLSTSLGAIGCGVAIFISVTVFQIFCMNYLFWKKIRLDIPKFFRECHVALGLPLAMSICFGFALNHVLVGLTLFTFIAKVILLSIFYIVVMWFIGMKVEEKLFFKQIFFKLVSKNQ